MIWKIFFGFRLKPRSASRASQGTVANAQESSLPASLYCKPAAASLQTCLNTHAQCADLQSCSSLVEVNLGFKSNCCFYFIDPRVRKIRNEASSCPGIFSRTLRFYYVANSPGSPLPHLLDGHRKLVGSSAIPARSCPGPVRYHWGSIVELVVVVSLLIQLNPRAQNIFLSFFLGFEDPA